MASRGNRPFYEEFLAKLEELEKRYRSDEKGFETGRPRKRVGDLRKIQARGRAEGGPDEL